MSTQEKPFHLEYLTIILKPSTPDEIMACVKNACEKFNQEKKTKIKLEELESKIQGYSALVKPTEEILEAEEERMGKSLNISMKIMTES